MVRIYYTSYKDAKKQSQAGRALLDFVLREYYNVNEYVLSRDENGKPYIKGDPIFFNISHSSGIAVLALSDGAVGVDTEPLRDIRREVVKRFTGVDSESVTERLFAWLQYESYGKMTGEGIGTSSPRMPHTFCHFELVYEGRTHYICVCTPKAEKCLTPCFVPLP